MEKPPDYDDFFGAGSIGRGGAGSTFGRRITGGGAGRSCGTFPTFFFTGASGSCFGGTASLAGGRSIPGGGPGGKTPGGGTGIARGTGTAPPIMPNPPPNPPANPTTAGLLMPGRCGLSGLS